MATRKAIRTALKLLSVNFAGGVSDERTQLWAIALEDVSDEQLARAVPEVIRTHRGEFIPPIAVIRDAAGANLEGAVDAEGLLRQIAATGSHSATAGFCGPSAQRVVQGFGAAIGEAYAMAGGGSCLFANEETTRAIASRDFRKALGAVGRVHRIPDQYRIGPVRAQRALGPGGLGDG